jgi:serine/threonine protein kinase
LPETGPNIPIDTVSPENQTPWTSGESVGRYSLLAKIATGGMAEIWLAKQAGPRGFEKVVVIKRIVDSLSADPEFVEMFLDEARIAAQLNHPNIVQIYDLGEHAGAYYIAMEYLPGENLSAVARTSLKSGTTLPIPFAVKIIAQAAEGLGHAHGRLGVNGKKLDVVHRDVSPQNIIVTYDGLVKVVDFGIAKAASRGSQTLGGQIKGKIAYMAPEQAQGGVLDARTDIFSLAIVLYELVTKSRLFHREDQFAAMSAVISPDPVERADVRSSAVPEALADILAKALSKRPDDRYPDARAFQTALEDWLKTQASVNAGDIGTFMDSLFSGRISARAKLIESANRGELTPSAARDVLKNDTDHSMPGRTGNRTAMTDPEAVAARRRAVLVLLPSALALLVSGVLLAKMLTRPDGPAVAAQAAVGTLGVETDPAGADVFVDGAAVGKSPITLPNIALSVHEIRAVLAGRAPVTKSVTLTQAGERAMVVLALPAIGAEPAKPVDAAPAGAAAPAPAQPVAAVTAPAKPVKPVAATTGKLSLNTQPWTRVSLNGKVLGDTPLIDAVLPVGRHMLKLQNEDKALNLNIEVEIKAGQTTKKVLKL